MPPASEGFHEAELTDAARDMHRAVISLKEELEAIDWYGQRVEAATDDELREILRHNREEEEEHASMLLEWIRRRDPSFDAALRTYVFTEGSIVGREAATVGREAAAAGGNAGAATRATVGSLRGGR